MTKEYEGIKSIAWATAMLGRTKEFPSYSVWMGKSDSRKLLGEELAERKLQHETMVSSLETFKSSRIKEGLTVGN